MVPNAVDVPENAILHERDVRGHLLDQFREIVRMNLNGIHSILLFALLLSISLDVKQNLTESADTEKRESGRHPIAERCTLAKC